MRLFTPLAFGLLAVLVAPPGLGQPVGSRTVIATVEGDLEVPMGEVQRRAERSLYRGIFDGAERYRTALHEATSQRLKALDFFRLGFDEDPAFTDSLGRRLSEEYLVAYYERVYEGPFLNDEAIRAEYETMGRVVNYRQIVLRKPEPRTEATLRALRSTVEQIRRQIDDGVAVATLVERYSEDEPSARVGGAMPPVPWEMSTRSARNAVLFQLEPGDAVSFETRDEYVVAVGESVDEVPVPPLELVYDRIVELQRGRFSQQANEAYYAERQALVDSVSVRWNDDALAQVVGWSRTPGFYEGEYGDVVAQHVAKNGDAVVFTDSAGALRLSDLPRLIREVLTLTSSGSRNDELVQDYLLEAVRADRMVQLAIESGLREDLFRPGTSSPVLAAAFADYYDQRRIEGRIPDATDSALRAFYEAHVDSLFYQLPTVYTEVIVRETEDEIGEVWEQVQAGVPFEDASSRRLNRSFERTREGEIVTRFNREPPYLGEVAFGLAAGEVAGPVAYETPAGRLFAIVKATERLDERQLRFDEVRERVAEAFRQHHRERLATEVEAELRARYAVEVDEEVWEQVLMAVGTHGPAEGRRR